MATDPPCWGIFRRRHGDTATDNPSFEPPSLTSASELYRSNFRGSKRFGRKLELGSTDGQLLDLQRDALEKAGCERVFEDTASGAKAERIGLTALLATLRKGDTVVIWRLDRLGRSLKDLIRLVEQLDAIGVGLRSLQESIDTGSTGGRLVFHLFGALASLSAT